LGEWAEVFGDQVVAAALLDRLLHHAVVVHIEGASYRLRQHADLVPDALRAKPAFNPAHETSQRLRRPPKQRAAQSA
jgi:IstB-like ATP binding protein